MMLSFFVIFFVSLISGRFGILICENGLYCASNDECPIGNHCVEFVDGQLNSTRCIPLDNLDDTYFCSLSEKSCECEFKLQFLNLFNIFFNLPVMPCCSGWCDNASKICHPLLPPECSLPTHVIKNY